MAEGAISQALYSKPRWWSEPFARNVVPVHDGRRSFLPNPSPQATLVKRTLRTKIHTETCWRENAFTQTFSFANVHRANFLPKPPCHAKSARPRGRLYPSNCSQWPFLRFTSGISPYHCGQLSESRRSFQQNASTFSAKRSSLSSKTLRPFLRNALAIPAKRSCLFCATTRPFHQKETPDGAGFLPVPRPVPGCPDYSPVFTSC